MTDAELRRSAPPPSLPEPPAHARVDGAWQWGRYLHPIPDPDLGVGPLRRMRLKEWHYTSVATDRLFLAFGLVQLGYVANAFLYLVDRKHPTVAREYEALSMLGRHLSFSPSSTRGETLWRHRDAEVRVAARPHGWDVRLDVVLGELAVAGGFHVQSAESLALLVDLGHERPAYTHKSAGLRVTGSLRMGDESVDLSGGLATLDWTRSLAVRETRWKWASFAGRANGRNVGLNLSAEVYDDAAGDSRENAFWLDGRVLPLGGVTFEVPREPGVGDWRIVSRNGDEVDLTFTPLGARAQHLDMKLLKSDFVQPYGLFRGKVAGVEIVEVMGVCEDHTSVW